ncbi:MAG TPA: hypothetical protein VNG69_06585 [Casimicrobiaceae bacterium]|nr:hypothetical protein [Casimicrobiaceae bacterium]
MPPLMRIWAWTSMIVALLLALRGVWPVAIALFLLSPAPVLLFARGHSDPLRLSLSWLVALAIGIAGLLLVAIAITASGGLPQVHEWRGLLAG